MFLSTNVWVDCIDDQSAWHDWAIGQLQACSERYQLHVNIIIYSELLIPEPEVSALDDLLDVYGVLRSPLPGPLRRSQPWLVRCTESAVEPSTDRCLTS